MRHFRNLIYFVLGVFIALAFSAPSYAFQVKTDPKAWYGPNFGGVTKGYNGPSPLYQKNPGQWNPPTFKSYGSFKKNGLDIPFSAKQDFYPKDLYPLVKEGIKDGFKGLVKGSLKPGPLLGAAVAGVLLEQGMDWLTDERCAVPFSGCWFFDKYSDTPFSATYDYVVYAYGAEILRFPNVAACCTASMVAEAQVYCQGQGYNVRYVSGYPGGALQGCKNFLGDTKINFSRGPQVRSDQTVTARPKSTADPAVVEQKAIAYVDANFNTLFPKAVEDDSILLIEEERPLVIEPVAPVSSPAVVTTSTQTNADGSTQTTTDTAIETYTVRCIPYGILGCNNLAPYKFTTDTTTTTQTTTCSQSGTCTTDVKTTQQTTPLPEQTPKEKNCEASPNSLECLNVGEIPDESIPTESKSLNFTWTPFSVSATCPAPYSMTIKGKTYLYQWTYYCDFATKTKPFLLILAFIGAYFIIMGARKE